MLHVAIFTLLLTTAKSQCCTQDSDCTTATPRCRFMGSNCGECVSECVYNQGCQSKADCVSANYGSNYCEFASSNCGQCDCECIPNGGDTTNCAVSDVCVLDPSIAGSDCGVCVNDVCASDCRYNNVPCGTGDSGLTKQCVQGTGADQCFECVDPCDGGCSANDMSNCAAVGLNSCRFANSAYDCGQCACECELGTANTCAGGYDCESNGLSGNCGECVDPCRDDCSVNGCSAFGNGMAPSGFYYQCLSDPATNCDSCQDPCVGGCSDSQYCTDPVDNTCAFTANNCGSCGPADPCANDCLNGSPGGCTGQGTSGNDLQCMPDTSGSSNCYSCQDPCDGGCTDSQYCTDPVDNTCVFNGVSNCGQCLPPDPTTTTADATTATADPCPNGCSSDSECDTLASSGFYYQCLPVPGTQCDSCQDPCEGGCFDNTQCGSVQTCVGSNAGTQCGVCKDCSNDCETVGCTYGTCTSSTDGSCSTCVVDCANDATFTDGCLTDNDCDELETCNESQTSASYPCGYCEPIPCADSCTYNDICDVTEPCTSVTGVACAQCVDPCVGNGFCRDDSTCLNNDDGNPVCLQFQSPNCGQCGPDPCAASDGCTVGDAGDAACTDADGYESECVGNVNTNECGECRCKDTCTTADAVTNVADSCGSIAAANEMCALDDNGCYSCQDACLASGGCYGDGGCESEQRCVLFNDGCGECSCANECDPTTGNNPCDSTTAGTPNAGSWDQCTENPSTGCYECGWTTTTTSTTSDGNATSSTVGGTVSTGIFHSGVYQYGIMVGVGFVTVVCSWM